MTAVVTIVRDTERKDATLGTLSAEGAKLCETLEEIWRNNQHNISRIPPGTYQMRWRYSPHHERNLWHVEGVPDRDSIEIHSGNTSADTRGCILLGRERWYRDGTTYVLSSRIALAQFEARLAPYQQSGCTIQVVDQFTQTQVSA